MIGNKKLVRFLLVFCLVPLIPSFQGYLSYDFEYDLGEPDRAEHNYCYFLLQNKVLEYYWDKKS